MTSSLATFATRLVAVSSRAAQNFALDGRFLRSPYGSRSARLRFLAAKYVAIIAGHQRIGWFGRELTYDNRWTPALLQDYPREIGAVIAAAGLRGEVAVLDIGGNVGQFGATIRGTLPDSRVWSMEPNPEPLSYLQRNAAGDDRWAVLDYGVSDADATLDFYFVPGKSSQGSVHAGNATLGLIGGQARHITVPVHPLTRERLGAARMPDRFDLVKVDVEGAERQALRGLAAIEWGHLLIELSTGRSGNMGSDELLDECEAIWGQRVEVAAVLSDQAATQEVVLRNPAFGTAGSPR